MVNVGAGEAAGLCGPRKTQLAPFRSVKVNLAYAVFTGALAAVATTLVSPVTAPSVFLTTPAASRANGRRGIGIGACTGVPAMIG